MSKIKHWDEQTQQWVIDGASNAANIELSNPGYVDENGESISVDLGFTKLDNRIFQAEKNIAWIYQNGAKGGGGGGGGGGGDSTAYTIEIEEGNRVYTSGTSVTIHITITGGSVKKNFNVIILDENGNTKGSYVITSLTRSEIRISNLTSATNRLTINANSGQNYASPVTLTVIAGAIKLTQTSVPNPTIYPLNPVGSVVINALNSTDSDLNIVVLCNEELIDSFDIRQAKESQFRIDSIVNYLDERKSTSIGETFTFEIYAVGVLNDNLLRSESISFSCTIVQPNTLYILTYGVDKTVPTNNVDLAKLNKFVYGNSIKFNYQLTYSRVAYSYYNVYYTITPCYFEGGMLIENTSRQVTGVISKVIKDFNLQFLFNTSSLPDDTIYDAENNLYKFVKVTLNAVFVDSSIIQDTKELYFTLSEAATKYITATNFNNSLFAYFSPVMGIPTGNITKWVYDNRNTRFTYSSQGVVQERYVNMQGHNLAGFMLLTDMQGMHLSGKSWTDLELPLFSENANEVNLLDGSGWTLSFTFRTDSNVDASDVVACIGKYNEDQKLLAGIEIQASKILYAVQTAQYSSNITKGDLVTIDIVGQRYVGPGDTEASPNHWFIKTFINGVLSMITSHTSNLMFNTDNSGAYGWYFNDYLHIGGRVIDGEIYDACSVHVYDFKGYSTALSDNEIILNYISATIYSLLEPNANPDMSTLNEMLQKNFIQIGTDGNYHSILFDENDETEYKDANSLLNSLVSALAESRIPYPIVVVNQLTSDSNFLGVTEAKFNEDLKKTVMAMLFPVTMDYYTMGNASPTRISNPNGMYISIQGTSSLRYNSKNYEIYMGKMDDGKTDFLVQMKEDWLPENRYTLKSDVMDSSHVNNVLIGSIINGLVTTLDNQGNTVKIVPLDNTPPMEKSGYLYASKVKHTSEGYPCILFINFKATGSNVANCRCMGIYNFNLGRYAYYNLGLKLLNGVTYTTEDEIYPRMVASYTEETSIEQGSPVYSMEVQENNAIAAFDLDDPDILKEGVFEFPYDSDGQGEANLLVLLSFLASFGANIETDRKVYINGDWKTPKQKKVDSKWLVVDEYYPSYDPRNYVLSTLSNYMNWNNMVSYYMIVIIFGLVDSMIKNLTLRSWTRSSMSSIWYMCFYDMDTALRVDNTGAETVPYNAHIHRYYTDNSRIALAVVLNHCSPIPGVFNQAYGAGYNTRLLEIVENIIPDSADAKTLQSVYKDLRTNLFPDPAEFIDKYYVGQINKVGSALYNYDYYLKYLQVEKTYNPATGTYGDNTYNYSDISYLHGNGSTNVKDWFVKRIKFLDGVYGVSTEGYSTLTGVTNTPLYDSWKENNATYITNVSPTSVSLGLTAESLIRITIATSNRPMSFWIDENPKQYRINNVGGTQVVTIFANNYLTSLDNFNQFTWNTISGLRFPLIKELSLRDLTNIKSDNFLKDSSNLQSLVKLDLHGVTLLDSNSSLVYTSLDIALQLPNLEELDISDSTFNEVPLSSSSVLRILNLSNTRIRTLSYSNLPMLERLIIDGCNLLETIDLRDCPKLKSLTVPPSVKTVFIGNCENLETLTAMYTESSRFISNLVNVTVSACPGLKTVNLSGLNNDNLEVSLIGAHNLEVIYLSRIVTRNITFPAKRDWTSLKTLSLNATSIGYLNYYNTTPLHTEYLDLDLFTELTDLNLGDNASIEAVKCSLLATVRLGDAALSNCSGLKNLYGHFILNGTRIFSGCALLTLNTDRIYSNYPVLTYPVPFVNDEYACNIEFSPFMTSTEEMFAGCSSISGNDFTMLMLLMHSNITNVTKMFNGCIGIDATLKYDVFRHCPNIEIATSFLENSGISGGIYSRLDTFDPENSTTYGTFDFLLNLQNASYMFASSSILFIDTNAFAPYIHNGSLKYSPILNADYMFAFCYNLHSYGKATRNELVTSGNLKSKSFFTNLKNLGGFPKNMFVGCSLVFMDIESEVVDGITFDYLFHYPGNYNIRKLDNSIYAGINLVGTLHDNVFGGRLKSDGTYRIVDFTVIEAPFENSGNQIMCDLSSMGKVFNNLQSTLLQAKGVLKGLRFTNSTIPIDIFEGCTVLNSIEGFFANEYITNNGQEYIFPLERMFKDCISLNNVSSLFLNAHNLNIKLIGEGFKNCSLVNVSSMLLASGVFGMIPYRLFYMNKNGVIQLTIENITNVFNLCFKLGYTSNRSLNIGHEYVRYDNTLYTTWNDCVIEVPGLRVPFQLDFTNFDGNDEWYIDGRDWADINPDLTTTSTYLNLNSTVFEYDRLLALALSVNLDRAEGYLNYMFPADYFRYCSPTCTMDGAFEGLSYTPKVLKGDDTGQYSLENGTVIDGLVGRLPCKLFSANTANTKITNVFRNLQFCAFINFNSYKFNTLRYNYRECRGIKYPPDLLSNNTALTDITGLFNNTYVEPGVDINNDLLYNNVNLVNVSSLFRNMQFDTLNYYESELGNNSQIDFASLFMYNPYLLNVSSLFAVDSLLDTTRGLLVIDSTLFGMLDTTTPYNSRLVDVSSCFYGNRRLTGNIPILDTGYFTRITKYTNYVEGVTKGSILNADMYISTHDSTWVPQAWLDE